MPKFKEFDKKMTVEIVENFQDILNYISSTIKFWNHDKEWPLNLIVDCCDEYHDKLEDIKNEFHINVSLSHIIDK